MSRCSVPSTALRIWLVAASISLVPVTSMAVDGVTLIDQNKALAGGVTPADIPGFPITISQGGSYRLSGNLTVPDSNTDAILVTAPNVTIALNGFSILGPNVCTRPASLLGLDCTASGSGVGVNAPSAVDVVVTNGTIRGMGSSALVVTGVAGGGPNRVEKIIAVSNGGTGIVVRNGVVINSAASLNRVHGIGVETGRVTGSYSTNNLANGLFISDGGYDNNTFSRNGFTGTSADVFGGGINLGQNFCSSAVCPSAQF